MCLIELIPTRCPHPPQVNWGVDLTEGKAQDPWKNALLSEETKEAMFRMHTQEE